MKYNKCSKFFLDIINRIWVHWSNLRYRRCVRHSTDIHVSDKVYSIEDIKIKVNMLYEEFKYTKDGIKELGDAVLPPCEAYSRYLKGTFKDDCDGFHSLVYHCLSNSGVTCYLLTVITGLSKNHCVLVFNFKNKWYVNDYTSVYGGYDSLEKAIEDYNSTYSIHYRAKKVKYNCFLRYDYLKGKFKFINAYELLNKD